MEQLTAQVAQRTGISDEQAQQAVEIVLSFLKERLPAPIAGQIDNVVGGSEAPAEGESPGGGLGGILGG